MIIDKLDIRQINIVLLDIEDKLKKISNADVIKSIQNDINYIKKTLNETTNGLNNGGTYNINITGSAVKAEQTEYAVRSSYSSQADTVTNSWLINKIYPVNSIYTTSTNSTPSFGFGTWEYVGSVSVGTSNMYCYRRVS